MSGATTVLKYEIFNVLRSKWLYAYAVLIALCTFGFTHISDEARKTELALVNVLGVIVPLVSVLFTTTYWYNSEHFTELLLSQPVSRHRLFWSRTGALVCSLAACVAVGLAGTCLLSGVWDQGLLWLVLTTVILGTVFCTGGALIAIFVHEKMWGIGLGLAMWFYCVSIHDGLLLTLLLTFRDYPMEGVSAALCAVNPIGLARVVLLMYFDAPLLLGHSGALLRKMVESGAGYWYSLGVAILWLTLPVIIAWRRFCKRNF